MDDNSQNVHQLKEYILLTVKNKIPKTIKQLTELVQKKYSLPQGEIIQHILDLQKQGKLNLKNETIQTPSSFANYITSHHSYWYWAVIVIAFVTTITILIITEYASPIVYVRYIFGSIFILFLPGYSLIKVLFPTKELDKIERTTLSVGISLALVTIIGLILNYTPLGIRTIPITLTLLALTSIFATVAIIMEHQNKLKEEDT